MPTARKKNKSVLTFLCSEFRDDCIVTVYFFTWNRCKFQQFKIELILFISGFTNAICNGNYSATDSCARRSGSGGFVIH